jgi:branched-chain amino acid transport system ATP-binding protein
MTARLRLDLVSKRFGGVVATDNLTLDFPASSIAAIIGPNGSGKTTLFNIITGHVRPDAGNIWLDDTPIVGRSTIEIVELGVGRAFQVASLFPTFTVEEALASAVASHIGQLSNLWRRFPTPDLTGRTERVLAVTGLDSIRGKLCQTLSHGDQKLVDIALALALEPRVLLLDEPTAGMGRNERHLMMDRIYQLWQQLKMTLIFIEHDMDIVFKVAQNVCVLRQGTKLAEGRPEEVRKNPAVIEAYLGSDFA